jgi:hypothetical protein
VSPHRAPLFAPCGSVEDERPPGSLAHEYWKQFYARKFSADGYKVQVEAPRVGGCVDVLARRNGERVAIEIETGKSDTVANVRTLDQALNVSSLLPQIRRRLQRSSERARKFDRAEAGHDYFTFVRPMSGIPNPLCSTYIQVLAANRENLFHVRTYSMSAIGKIMVY